jgi:hypothetical protein
MFRFPTAFLFAALLAMPKVSLAQEDARPRAAVKQKQLKQQRQADALERFLSLPPQQQRRLLEQMNPARRRQAQALLQAWDLLSDDERANLKGRFSALMSLPQDRRQAVRQEIRILRLMSTEDRRKRLADIKSRFSPGEMDILYGVAGEQEQQEEE